VDEWTALQRGELGAEIASVVEAVTQEGRKLEIDALLNGQRWSSTRGGGNDLRNTLTSAFVHRMRPEDARMLTGLRAEQLPKDMLQLAPGECYVQTTGTILGITRSACRRSRSKPSTQEVRAARSRQPDTTEAPP